MVSVEICVNQKIIAYPNADLHIYLFWYLSGEIVHRQSGPSALRIFTLQPFRNASGYLQSVAKKATPRDVAGESARAACPVSPWGGFFLIRAQRTPIWWRSPEMPCGSRRLGTPGLPGLSACSAAPDRAVPARTTRPLSAWRGVPRQGPQNYVRWHSVSNRRGLMSTARRVPHIWWLRHAGEPDIVRASALDRRAVST